MTFDPVALLLLFYVVCFFVAMNDTKWGGRK